MGIAARNFRLFLLYRGLTRALIFAPYIQHFMTATRGMDRTEYGILQAIYYIAVVLLEVPSGVVADRLGRKGTLVIGSVAAGLGCFGCAVADSFWVFAIAEVLLAGGTAFISGADSALLYDSLAVDRREHEYPRAEGAAQAVWLGMSAVGFLLCDLFLYLNGSTDITLAYWITGGFASAGALVALTMIEPPVKRRLSTREITFGALRNVVSIPGILRLTVYSVGVFALLRMAMVMFFNPALKAAAVPVYLFGTFFAVVNIVGAVAAWRAHKWLSRYGEKAMLVAMPVSMIGMFLLLLVIRHPLAGLLFCVQGAAFAVYPLLMRTILNRLVASPERRATTLSIESMICRVAFGPIAVFSGWAMGVLTLNWAIGLTVLIACLPFTVFPWLPAARKAAV